MSFHPYLQVQVGDAPISTIPPTFIQSLSYKSALGGLSTLSFRIIDPTYSTVEELLILSDTEKQPIYARFGYLDRTGNISSAWLQSRLMNYVPRLSHKGMEITASCLVDTQDRIVIVEPKVYEGKVSRVAEQIADDMNLTPCIEETEDDGNEVSEVSPTGVQSPRQWATRNMTLFDFIKKELLDEARSKTSQSAYFVQVTGHKRERKPILHFHTQEFSQCLSKQRTVKEFTYLAGRQDIVLDFQPTYNSAVLGALGSQVTMRHYDPVTKRYVTRTHNNLTNPDSVSVGGGDRTNNSPVDPTNPTSDASSQGYIIAGEGSGADAEEVAERSSRNLWEVLKGSSFQASLTLVGLPENTDIEAKDFIKVTVLIPDTSRYPAFREHWSSGTYLVTEAVHDIESQYSITCQLQRDSASIGGSESVGAELAG